MGRCAPSDRHRSLGVRRRYVPGYSYGLYSSGRRYVPGYLRKETTRTRTKSCCDEWDVVGAKRIVVAVDAIEAMTSVGANDFNGGPLMYLKGGGQMIFASEFSPLDVAELIRAEL